MTRKFKVIEPFKLYDDEGSDLFEPNVDDVFEVSSITNDIAFIIYDDKGFDLSESDFNYILNCDKITELTT